jgi:hypothetical protein
MGETIEPLGIDLDAYPRGFLMQPECSRYQHHDGHRSGKHVDQHLRVLLHLTTIRWEFGFIA